MAEIAFLSQVIATENTTNWSLNVQFFQLYVTLEVKGFSMYKTTVPGICLPCHEVPVVSGTICSQALLSLPKVLTPRLVSKQNSPY